MWSDPEDANGFGMSPRGAGFLFGPDVVQNFCETNKVDLICRYGLSVIVKYVANPYLFLDFQLLIIA